MKKFFALVLALVMAMSLVACGGSSSKDEAPAADSTTDEIPTFEWSLSCEYSAENHQTKALEDAAKMIEEQTDGHVKITVYPNMALGDYTVVYGQVITGDIEIRYLFAVGIILCRAVAVPEFSIIQRITRSDYHTGTMIDNHIHDDMDTVFIRFTAKFF